VSARVESDQAVANGAALAAPQAPPALAPIALDADLELGNDLPGDHPAWARDTISLSQRARVLFAALKPCVVRVIAHWEHRVRSILVSGRTLTVDVSGSYRLE